MWVVYLWWWLLYTRIVLNCTLIQRESCMHWFNVVVLVSISQSRDVPYSSWCKLSMSRSHLGHLCLWPRLIFGQTVQAKIIIAYTVILLLLLERKDFGGVLSKYCKDTLHLEDVQGHLNRKWKQIKWVNSAIAVNGSVKSHTRLRALGTELIPVSWQSARKWH